MNDASTKPSTSEEGQDAGPKQRKRPGRVPVSCAECRRLKLRCDRKVPCETCVKRGCEAICPEGSLVTGKNRLAFRDVEGLPKQIETLRNRITALETALRTLQAVTSDEPHPLLRNDTENSEISENQQNGSGSDSSPRRCPEDEEFLDAFGTLTVGLSGESRFFGQTARSEYLIHASEPIGACRSPKAPRMSDHMYEACASGFDTTCFDPSLKRDILLFLPSLSQACRLCDIFLEHGEYYYYPYPRAQLFDEILGPVYHSASLADASLWSPHALSLLFIVFALGTLLDIGGPPDRAQAQEYFYLSRLALRFSPPVRETTLLAIQSLIYMSCYMEVSDLEAAHHLSHMAWAQVGYTVQLAHGIGLHVNSAKWQLDGEASGMRSRVFWQLFQQDAWSSFGFGRPPIMTLSFIDCQFPKDPEESIDAEGHRHCGFHHWSWQYTKLLHSVITTAFSAKAPTYAAVLELDRKVRDFYVPQRYRCQTECSESQMPTNSLRMQRLKIIAYKEATLLNLHRPYFAQALSELPQDLLQHRYGASVMAIYRSAWRLIESLVDTYKWVPIITARLTQPWSHTLSSAIVLCLLINRAPCSGLTVSALGELDKLCELFERAADQSRIAANNLEVVQRLRRQAHEAYEKFESRDKNHPSFTELERLGGKTRLLSEVAPTLADDPLDSHRRGSKSSSTTTPGGSATTETIVHRTIIEDMKNFQSTTSFMHHITADFAVDSSGSGPSDSATHAASQIYRPFPDMYLGGEDFGSTSSPFTLDTAQTYTASLPPVLDATWQSFVEQLGF